MKIILTSDGISSSAIENTLLKLIECKASTKRACIVTTASSKKDKSTTAIHTRDVFKRLGFASADFIDIEHEDPKRLIQYDVIYINGGNPLYLLHQIKSRGAMSVFNELADQNKLLVGTSAGAMVLGESLHHVNELNTLAGYENMDIEELSDYSAVGLIDIAVVPHYNRFITSRADFEMELEKLEEIMNIHFERLSDGDAIVIDDRMISFVSGGE